MKTWGILATVTACVIVAAFVFHRPNITLDLQDSRDISAVNWPVDAAGTLFSIDKPVRVHLILPNGVDIRADTRLITVDREDRSIKSIGLSFESMDTSTVWKTMRDLIDRFGLESYGSSEHALSELMVWREEVNSGAYPPSYSAGSEFEDAPVTVFAAIHQSFNKKKPFSLSGIYLA